MMDARILCLRVAGAKQSLSCSLGEPETRLRIIMVTVFLKSFRRIRTNSNELFLLPTYDQTYLFVQSQFLTDEARSGTYGRFEKPLTRWSTMLPPDLVRGRTPRIEKAMREVDNEKGHVPVSATLICSCRIPMGTSWSSRLSSL